MGILVVKISSLQCSRTAHVEVIRARVWGFWQFGNSVFWGLWEFLTLGRGLGVCFTGLVTSFGVGRRGG